MGSISAYPDKEIQHCKSSSSEWNSDEEEFFAARISTSSSIFWVVYFVELKTWATGLNFGEALGYECPHFQSIGELSNFQKRSNN